MYIFAHFSTEPEVADDILTAYLAADAARQTAETVIDNNRNLQPTIASIETETDTMKTMVQNTLDAEQTLTAERKFMAHLHSQIRILILIPIPISFLQLEVRIRTGVQLHAV